MDFNGLDIAIMVLLGLSLLMGVLRGFIYEAMSLVTWGVALIAARALGTQVAPIFEGLLAGADVRMAAAYVVIVLVVWLAGKVITRASSTLIEKVGLGSLDKLLGGLFGGLRGVLVVVLLVAVASLTDLRRQASWQDSTLMPWFEGMRDWGAEQLEQYRSRPQA